MNYVTTNLPPDHYVRQWIHRATEGSHTVVELGAGFFDKLEQVSPTVTKKIGIEIWEPYIKNAKYNDCIKVQGELLKFDKYITPEECDCAMLIDVVEHLESSDGVALIKRLQTIFNKIIIQSPEGNYPQDKDVTGYGAHVYQTHRSVWTADALESLGFTTEVIENFHMMSKGDTGGLFAVWNR